MHLAFSSGMFYLLGDLRPFCSIIDRQRTDVSKLR